LLRFLSRLFSKDREKGGSKNVAMERLKLVLVHDRVNACPQLLEALKEDLIRVIREYIEIDEDALDISFDSMENTVALVANIPVLKIKKGLD
jgi:cell division topological specificity factor